MLDKLVERIRSNIPFALIVMFNARVPLGSIWFLEFKESIVFVAAISELYI